MFNRVTSLAGFALLTLACAVATHAADAAWMVDKPAVAVVPEVQLGKSSLTAPLGWMLVEVSGTFTLAESAAEVQSQAISLLPSNQNQTNIPALPDGFEHGLAAIAEWKPAGRPSYVAVQPAMTNGSSTIRLAGGAKVLVKKQGAGSPVMLTFEKGSLPLSMVFLTPLPREKKCKFDLHVGGAPPVALPEFDASIAQAAPPLPKALAAQAKKAFAAKRMFFIWSDKTVAKPSEIVLHILPNPGMKREDLLMGDDETAVVTRLVRTEQGQRVPFVSSSQGPHFSMNDSQFSGREKASIVLIRAKDALPPGNFENAVPLSNVLEVTLVFDKK